MANVGFMMHPSGQVLINKEQIISSIFNHTKRKNSENNIHCLL